MALVAGPSDEGATHPPDTCMDESDRSVHRGTALHLQIRLVWNCLGTLPGAKERLRLIRAAIRLMRIPSC